MAKNANVQKTPYRTIDSDANDRYDDPFQYIQPGKAANDQGNVAEFPQNRRIANATAQYQYKEKTKTPGNTPNPPTQQKPLRQATQTIVAPAQRAKVVATINTVLYWVIPAWIFILLPLNLFILFAIGTASTIPDSDILSAATNLFVDITGVFTWLYILLCTITAIIHGGAAFHLLTAGIKPLFGNGGGYKVATFLISIITALLPGAAILPMIAIWIFLVKVYPK